MKRQVLAVAAMLLAVFLLPAVGSANSSQLWGTNGELWNPHGRLPDFSQAGYHAGEAAIPDVPVKGNVRDFGARGDGSTDDTAAFAAAIAAVNDGALLIPAGRYRLSDILHIRKSNLVLRGEGSGSSGTTLYFTRNLMQILGLQNPPNPNVLSWSGGLIRIEPVGPDGSAVAVTAARVRGDNQLTVSSTANLVSGAMVYLRLIDTSARTLWRHVHNDQVDPATVPGLCANTSLHWPVRIATVQGNRVTLAQPLRTDLRMEWVPALVPMNSLSEVGIEHLRIEFPITAYPGHHNEHGFNAIDFEKSVVNSWVRDVEFANADSGVFTGDRCKWITLTDLRYVSARAPDSHGWQGHHGMAFSRTADSLMTRFHFAGKFVHELTVTHQASGNVFSQGDGVQTLALDHHRDWPFENLFTSLTSASEYQDTTGNACEGPSSAARSTFWNLPAPFKAPSWAFIQANSIGALDLSVSDSRTAEREWNERVASLEPTDLYRAQLNHRLGISPPGVDGGVDGGNPSSINGGSNAGAQHQGCGGSGVPPSVLLAVSAMLRRTWRRGNGTGGPKPHKGAPGAAARGPAAFGYASRVWMSISDVNVR